MLILVTYDVNTESSEGRKRLRWVAKMCTDYGQRVQNSVFELELNAVQLVTVQARLAQLINTETDSLRFYNLGNNYKSKILHYGAKPSVDMNEPLIV